MDIQKFIQFINPLTDTDNSSVASRNIAEDVSEVSRKCFYLKCLYSEAEWLTFYTLLIKSLLHLSIKIYTSVKQLIKSTILVDKLSFCTLNIYHSLSIVAKRKKYITKLVTKNQTFWCWNNLWYITFINIGNCLTEMLEN